MVKLVVKDLVKIYNNRKVVEKVSFQIKQGEIVGLLGANGAGKTTTFHMIVGLIKPNSGKIFLRRNTIEEELTNLPMYKRARKGIVYLPQEPSVFQHLTVEENILAILEVLNLNKFEQVEKMKFLLKELGIEYIRKYKAYTLSGGERRRLEICRALVTNPLFILLDEPFSGIDPITVEDIQKILYQLKMKNLGIVITDHNVREILRIIDYAYIIQQGKPLAVGNPHDIANNPLVKKVYLGENFKL